MSCRRAEQFSTSTVFLSDESRFWMQAIWCQSTADLTDMKEVQEERACLSSINQHGRCWMVSCVSHRFHGVTFRGQMWEGRLDCTSILGLLLNTWNGWGTDLQKTGRLPTVPSWLISIAHSNLFKSPRFLSPLTQMVSTWTSSCANFEFLSPSSGHFNKLWSTLTCAEGNT